MRDHVPSSPFPVPVQSGEQSEVVAPPIDTEHWNVYHSTWYGFKLKYPASWNTPKPVYASAGFRGEYRYQFRGEEDARYTGFDVVVYSAGKVKELSGTDEFPTAKEQSAEASSRCVDDPVSPVSVEEYPAAKIYVSPDNACYEAAHFYTLIHNNYIYNIVPVLEKMDDGLSASESEDTHDLPEFVATASTFELTDIVRSKPKPKITAPHPASDVKRDSQGRRVCAKKNDKPSKSDKGKKKHLDRECCLDPDEYPNPWCHYPLEKYGKLLEEL